jgi:hypothetical protein
MGNVNGRRSLTRGWVIFPDTKSKATDGNCWLGIYHDVV